MRFYKNKPRVVAVVAVLILLVIGWMAFGSNHASKTTTQTTKPANGATGQSTTVSGGATAAFIETSDFKYEMPAGWLQIKKEVLDQEGATSGIGRVSTATATFRTSVSSSTPKDNNELKNSTLNDIKKNAPNFALLSSTSTKVSGQSGQIFTYSFTDANGKNKIRQQLTAVPYKGKTFFLLASAIDQDFDKQVSEFSKILASFHFK